MVGAVPVASADVVVVGGGVNGLVCALLLGKSGLKIIVVEEKPALGGLLRSELPFPRARRVAMTGTSSLGLVLPDIERLTSVTLPLATRDPARFVPTTERGRHILARAGTAAFVEAIRAFAPDDAVGVAALHAELDALARDLEGAWLAPSLSVADTGKRFVAPARLDAFTAVTTGSLAAYVARFPIRSSVVKALIAADALTGSFVALDAGGSAAALLVRHATRLGGEKVPAAGHAGVVAALAAAAQKAGVSIMTGSSVTQIKVEGTSVGGVVLRDGTRITCDSVVASADPFRLRALVGADRLPAEYSRKIDTFARAGGPARVHLALAALPRFTALPEDRGQHRAATWLLPGGDDAVRVLTQAFTDANAGRLPLVSPLEIVFEPQADGLHLASITVPFAPYDIVGTTWVAEEERLLAGVLDVVESFAPGTRSLVVDAAVYHPKKIETQLGITRGHLHHIDDVLLFGDRLPVSTSVTGLYACGAACAPAGGVFGAAGVQAARRILSDLELGLERTELRPAKT